MARWGRFDFREFERLKKNYEQLAKNLDTFLREFLLEMAMRAERKIKKRTPVDTGALRRGWEIGEVQRVGDKYIVEIINETEYAGFVEYGHRIGPDRRKWVEGRFMMTISMQEIERELPRYLERRLGKWLKERKVS
ncbi:HK97 gp10 family phage protein [Symbiobacterium terraclitae]|uniref:HK97 gp10 family phage protein n=1 Tax=Symbiobacterium terraclitae TaxID=557451 RepID=UPI0035B54216